MKHLELAIALVLGLAVTADAGAQTVGLHWDGCTGPVDKIMVPGSTVAVYAAVLGQSQTAKSYQVQLRIGRDVSALPDAWRFDASGCQTASQIVIDHLTGSSKACPPFMGTIAPNFQLKDFTYDPGTGLAHTFIANAYPNGGLGNPGATNPATRYFLARWTFDHTYSVHGPGTPGETCGGLETPICLASVSFSTNSASWVNTNDQEVPWAFSNIAVIANSDLRCPNGSEIPAKAATWGSIKDQYKR